MSTIGEPSNRGSIERYVASALSNSDFDRHSRVHPFSRASTKYRDQSDRFERDAGYNIATRRTLSSLADTRREVDKTYIDSIEHVATELFLEIGCASGVFNRRWGPLKFLPESDEARRYLYVPGDHYRPPSIVVLDPKATGSPVRLTSSILPSPAADKVLAAIASRPESSAMPVFLVDIVRIHGVEALLDILDIVRPEIIYGRKPKMVRLCAPWPHLDVACNAQRSTAGIFCRDDAGQLGLTACLHGTGPKGTDVQIGLSTFKVARVNEVQDIVFIPVGNGYNVPSLHATAGVHPDKSPSIYDNASFWGASSGHTQTRIISSDAYVFRHRPTMQLRIQTTANTNTGDSGAALISSDGFVLAFAFERTAFNEFPEMTDWIWAANALRSLNLTTF